jgi:hypothetical protein
LNLLADSIATGKVLLLVNYLNTRPDAGQMRVFHTEKKRILKTEDSLAVPAAHLKPHEAIPGFCRESLAEPRAEGQPRGPDVGAPGISFRGAGEASPMSRTETSTRCSGLSLPTHGERADTTWRFVMKIERT